MRRSPTLARFIFLLLLIEFLDELVGGVRAAAWPLIREDLALSYTQVGLLLSLPGVLAGFIEPALGILADSGRRRVLILGGGCIFVFSTMLAASSTTFAMLLAADILFNPASGAFVSLSQTALMDLEPGRHEQNMSRWTFSGSLAVVAGPLLLGIATLLGFGWRAPLWAVALFSGVVLALSWRAFSTRGMLPAHNEDHPGLREGLRGALRSARRPDVLRILVLLQFGELMMSVFGGFLALYLVDVAGFTPAQSGLAIAVYTGVGLLGDFLLIPLLERVPGLVYLRVSAGLVLVLLPSFLLAQQAPAQLILLGLLGLLNAGWYAILKGQLYAGMPGQSGTALSIYGMFAPIHYLLPLVIGFAAQRFGLAQAMWLLVLGPAALLVGLPTPKSAQKPI